MFNFFSLNPPVHTEGRLQTIVQSMHNLFPQEGCFLLRYRASRSTLRCVGKRGGMMKGEGKRGGYRFRDFGIWNYGSICVALILRPSSTDPIPCDRNPWESLFFVCSSSVLFFFLFSPLSARSVG